MQRYRWLLLASLAVCACDRPKEPDARELAARALRGTLTFPGSTMIKVGAGLEAAEVHLSSPAPVTQVADWYRSMLSLNGWDLKNEGKSQDGSATIYAERAGKPLWITLRAKSDGVGTDYTLIGAVPDTTPAPRPVAKPRDN